MKGKIRIVHVFGEMNRGGAETLIMNIYRKIDKSKIQFDFILHTEKECAYDNEIYKLGGEIYRVPRFKVSNFIEYIKAWNDILKKNAYKWDIIHGHMYSTASIYLPIAKKYGLKAISHSHNTSNGTGVSSIIKDVIQFPVRYIADSKMGCSNAANKWLYGERICKKEDCYVLNNAIDLTKFRYKEDLRRSMRNQLNISNKFVIGHVGRFVDQKNHSFLIDIFKHIYDKNKNSVLLLVGDGSLKKKIENKVKELGLEENVIFAGSRADVAELFQCMDVFLLPSKYEGLPVVMVEAQASGLPCFISDSINDEVKIVESVKQISLNDSPKQWSEKILSEKNERYDAISKLKYAGYDIEIVTKWIMEFYYKMLGGIKNA